ncbi:hypothetical protein SKAU_G00283910 [Synaphobranchus kaupii]|uniref:Anaphase-promoting complex subunit CDC26 n=1 Tax=Synaphobranchus kaupii TaxID=118154 RepID=A0A9Q1IP82_SYNKA|nr:hypothetical protein SKAU_G00283910 [Synaphobranchus kaupii]
MGFGNGGFLTTVYKLQFENAAPQSPTRLELKLDDIEEFDSVKKELESRKKQREEVDVVGVATSGENGRGNGSDVTAQGGAVLTRGLAGPVARFSAAVLLRERGLPMTLPAAGLSSMMMCSSAGGLLQHWDRSMIIFG